jgi:hypothetical protein
LPTTTNWALPYPSANDAPNGATQIAALASAVDSALESRKTLFARKAGDTSRASTTTYADDPDLTVPVAASAVYRVDCGLFYVSSSQTAGDFKAQVVGPSGAALQGTVVGLAAGATTVADDLVSGLTLTTGLSVGVVFTADPYNPCHITGVLVTAGTAGTFKVQWSQNVSHATATVLKANSYLALSRVA